MYQVGVKRAFKSNHFLIGGDWGAENSPHSHDFEAEVVLTSDRLDRHGYVFDISVLHRALDQAVARVENRLLNELPEFRGLNPSVEHFARILTEWMLGETGTQGMRSLRVQLWEDRSAWASYEKLL